ncbi:hypothetical protein H0H81_006010 [Sphagnurus paluster]|uniref:SLS1 N-terminal domain-containing protein n=1 Tax=Sphagnurus paluster TaxID=117069 RepID=A0A9P7KKY8_9AGAR|nr:hypothetical protein H0H81_006010 [Sphagnurus paluster]
MSFLLRRSICYLSLPSQISRPFSSTHTRARPVPGPIESLSLSSSKSKAQRKRKTVAPPPKQDRDVTTQEPLRNLLKETKLQDYLNHIASTSEQVTLADIERYRPSKYAEPHSPSYEEEYHSLVETLVRSFSLNQLRTFLDMYHLTPPTKRTKWELAVTIVERQWNWPSLTIVKNEKREWTEVVHQSFPLDARQSFLILGKDGADLLALSSEFNAHVSFSTNPLSLKVEGLRGSLRNLGRYIEEFKAGIKEELFQLPPRGTVDQECLQHISRMSGVFVQDAGNGLIRISYRNEDKSAAHFAKQLTLRAAVEHISPQLNTLVYSTQDSGKPMLSPNSTYSLYPFLSSRSNKGPSSNGSLFRIRRVGDWIQSTLQKTAKATDVLEATFPTDLHG